MVGFEVSRGNRQILIITFLGIRKKSLVTRIYQEAQKAYATQHMKRSNKMKVRFLWIGVVVLFIAGVLPTSSYARLDPKTT